MKKLLFILALIPFGTVYAQEPSLMEQEALIMEQITSDGQIKVQLLWPEVEPDEFYGIQINFLDPNTDELLDDVNIGYAIMVTQQGSIIEMYDHLHTDNGDEEFLVMFPEHGKGTAQIGIIIDSITKGSDTIQIDEELTFNVEVVPEFAALVLIVMAIAFTGVIATLRLKNSVSFSFKA